MKRISAIILALALAAIGIFLFIRPGRLPTGQPPLVEITDPSLAALRAEFNRASSGLRVILLLSPT
jgi:hypothetical protein